MMNFVMGLLLLNNLVTAAVAIEDCLRNLSLRDGNHIIEMDVI
jgi:hypothetical protein